MCFIFTFGEHTFRKEVEGYQGIVCRCYNCGNYSGHVIKSHPWFTFCFVPVIPLSFKGDEDVTCHICNFAQPLEHRQDVIAMRHGGGGGDGGGGQGMPMQPQGGPPPGGGGPGPQGWQGGGEGQGQGPGPKPPQYG